jgi:hypothetical protein
MILVPRFSASVRYLMLGSGVAAALLSAILRGVAPGGGWIAVLFVPLGVVALGWFAMVGIAQDQPFESLDPQERLEALGLAWDRAPFVPTALTGAVLVAYLTAGLAGIWEASATWGPDWNGQRFALWAVAGCMWIVIGIASASTAHNPSVRTCALRQIAARWVNQWHKAWLDCACDIAGQKACHRFDLPIDSTKPFPLVTSDPQAQTDMPATRECITILAAGTYLGIRAGSYLEVRKTSAEQAASPKPEIRMTPTISEPSTISEREAHYADIASINYQRQEKDPQKRGPGAARGVLLIEIAGAQPLSYPTEEEQTTTAIEEIRRRTRAAKLK